MRDELGKGTPVCYLITSSLGGNVIKIFLQKLKDQNPSFSPRYNFGEELNNFEKYYYYLVTVFLTPFVLATLSLVPSILKIKY